MTQVPLRILITDSKLLEIESIKEQLDKLQKAGHLVTIDESLSTYDFITGPNCWLLRHEVAGLFTLALTNARKIANADQERVDAHHATQASKRAASKPRKGTPRTRKAPVTVEAAGQLSLIAEPTGDTTV
jgi:hypothetical protein